MRNDLFHKHVQAAAQCSELGSVTSAMHHMRVALWLVENRFKINYLEYMKKCSDNGFITCYAEYHFKNFSNIPQSFKNA